MKRPLFDTNSLIDLLVRRESFYAEATAKEFLSTF